MRCKLCKETYKKKFFYQPYCMEKPECIKAFSDEVQAKKWKVEKKSLKEKLKTLGDWKKELQTLINQIVREIDNGQPCIATGTLNGKRNAGHRVSVGANATIRFHLDNVHIQSEHSNKWKAGDSIRYDEGLEKIYGIEYLNYAKSLSTMPEIHLTVPDIKEAITKCREIVKELKVKGYIYDAKTRMNLRKLYNKRIGIYTICL